MLLQLSRSRDIDTRWWIIFFQGEEKMAGPEQASSSLHRGSQRRVCVMKHAKRSVRLLRSHPSPGLKTKTETLPSRPSRQTCTFPPPITPFSGDFLHSYVRWQPYPPLSGRLNTNQICLQVGKHKGVKTVNSQKPEGSYRRSSPTQPAEQCILHLPKPKRDPLFSRPSPYRHTYQQHREQ